MWEVVWKWAIFREQLGVDGEASPGVHELPKLPQPEPGETEETKDPVIGLAG